MLSPLTCFPCEVFMNTIRHSGQAIISPRCASELYPQPTAPRFLGAQVCAAPPWHFTGRRTLPDADLTGELNENACF